MRIRYSLRGRDAGVGGIRTDPSTISDDNSADTAHGATGPRPDDADATSGAAATDGISRHGCAVRSKKC